MFTRVLRAKIHRATITQTDLDYVGSITIDQDLLEATGIRPNEFVLISDVDNGNRFETYVIKGEQGSGIIGVNGPAARLVAIGHRIIIFSTLYMDPSKMDDHYAQIVLVDEENRITRQMRYPSSLHETIPL